MSKKELKKAEDFLNSAHGELTITINGLAPTKVRGECNDAGAILAAFSGIKILEAQSGFDFEEIISLMQQLQQGLGYEIFDRSAQ